MQAGTAPLPRLLRGVGREPIVSLQRHLDLHGPLRSDVSADVLITEIEQSGLRGHGGAGFPTGRKLRTVAGGRGSKTVVINGTEGEPASKKDRAMLREAPHLVLDGAAVAARAVGAGVAYIAHCESDVRGAASLEAAIDERAGLRGDPEFVRFEAPELFLSGQETALINLINGGACTPTFDRRPFERGVRGRPTLVQNAETTAHLALIARHGARWFRQLGPESDPGSALLTVSGAVEAPGVYEIEHGTSLESMLETVRVREPLRAVLIGGYFGSWLPVGRVGSTDLSPTRAARTGRESRRRGDRRARPLRLPGCGAGPRDPLVRRAVGRSVWTVRARVGRGRRGISTDRGRLWRRACAAGSASMDGRATGSRCVPAPGRRRGVHLQRAGGVRRRTRGPRRPRAMSAM